MGMSKYNKLFRRSEQSLGYWIAGVEVEFTEELARVMGEKRVSRAELARRIGSSQAYITKVLRGNVNFTMATMVKLARALDMDLKLRLAPRDVEASSEDERSGRWHHGAVVFPPTEAATPGGRLSMVAGEWRSPARAHRTEEPNTRIDSSPVGTEETYGSPAVAA